MPYPLGVGHRQKSTSIHTEHNRNEAPQGRHRNQGKNMAHFKGRWAACLALAASLCGPAWGQIVIPPGSGIDLGGGDMDNGCLSVTTSGDLILGAGTLTTGGLTFDSGATITGTGGTLAVSGDLLAVPPINLGTSTVQLSDICAPGVPLAIGGNIVVRNLVLLSTTATPATFTLPVGTHITVLGTVTLGAPGAPVVLAPSGPGTAVVTLAPGATVQNPSGSSIPPTVRFGRPSTTPSIPTMDTYGLALLSLVLGALAMRMRRRSVPALPQHPYR